MGRNHFFKITRKKPVYKKEEKSTIGSYEVFDAKSKRRHTHTVIFRKSNEYDICSVRGW